MHQRPSHGIMFGITFSAMSGIMFAIMSIMFGIMCGTIRGKPPVGSVAAESEEMEMFMISLIAAYSNNRVIGKEGALPWRIEGEQKRFKELTTGNIVIMGRRTYEEIGKPLPRRITIVVSGTKNFDSENCYTAESLSEALLLSDRIASPASPDQSGGRDIFICGGARLYRESLPLVDKMYITEIDRDIEGDTYFPDFDPLLFFKKVEAAYPGDIPYRYVTYTRKCKTAREEANPSGICP